MLHRDVLILQRPAVERGFRHEYAVVDANGERIGTVTETRPAALGSRLRLAVADLPFLPVTLELQDRSGASVLRMSKRWGRNATHVARGDNTPLGCVRRRWRLGKPRFELLSDDKTVGQVRARNWRATEFVLVDPNGQELARAEKERPGGDQEQAAVNEDQYLIRIQHDVTDPLCSFAVGAALALEAVVPHHD